MSRNKRQSIVTDVSLLPKDDVVELYNELATCYLNLKQEMDLSKQKLHQTKLQSNMLLASQNDLQSELDNIHVIHRQELSDNQRQSHAITEALKNNVRELTKDKIQLESVVEELSKQLVVAQKESDDLHFELENQKPLQRYSDGSSDFLEEEVRTLKETLKEVESLLCERNGMIKDQRSQMDEINERFLCLKDNLESKKLEVEEKDLEIESLQEKLHDTQMEIAVLKTTPDNANRKGNSLFAEVDDQRQKMKTVLQEERAHYLEMKKTCNAKEMEIRRLKRENMNIKQEILACSDLIRRGEQIAIEAMSVQIAKQQDECKELNNRLYATERRLIDLATEQNLGWVESVLSTANEETSKLRGEQMTLMLRNTSMAENLHKNQKELAKIRLDCVKLKILLSRIVASNSIKICEDDYIDIALDDEVFEGIKSEEFEEVSGVEEHSSELCDDTLNESTIILLGGRERLAKLIPSSSCSRSEDLDDKENLRKDDKYERVEITQAKLLQHQESPLKLRQLPILGSIEINSPVQKEKSVKFSEVIETNIIDDSEEKLKQSTQARKPQGVTVRRIVIPSKLPTKKN